MATSRSCDRNLTTLETRDFPKIWYEHFASRAMQFEPVQLLTYYQ
jgi:hypothetical protein